MVAKKRELTPAMQAKKAVYRDMILQFYVESADPKALTKPMTYLSKNVIRSVDHNRVTKFFTAKELAEIQKEALKLRRERFAPKLAQIDEALLKSALKGSEKAIRLAYERFEGWSAKNLQPFSGDIGTVVIIERSDNPSAGDNSKGSVSVTINHGEVKKPAEQLKSANPPVDSGEDKAVTNKQEAIPIDINITTKKRANRRKKPQKRIPSVTKKPVAPF
jgi:hypothetical protein